MTTTTDNSRDRVAAYEERKRRAGLVQRKRWAHPDDWVAIDKFIKELHRRRQAATGGGL